MNSESTKQKLIRITSDDRDKELYPNTNKFEVIFDKVDDLQKVYAIVVKHVSFTNTFYNMNNDSIVINYNGSDFTVTISGIQYTVYDVLDFINGTVPFPSSHNWTYDTQLNKIKVIADATHNIQIVGGSLADKLGLVAQTVPQTNNFFGTYQVNLAGVQHVFIYSKTLAQGKNMIKGRYLQEVPALIMIPNDVPFGSVKHYETQHDNLDVVNFDDQINLQKIDIEVRDGAGDLLDTSNHNVSLVLKILYA
jgi:hypothetical protein